MSPRIPRMEHEGIIFYENGKAWTLRKWVRWLRWVRVLSMDAQR